MASSGMEIPNSSSTDMIISIKSKLSNPKSFLIIEPNWI